MQMKTFTAVVPLVVGLACILQHGDAYAGTTALNSHANPASACQLSLPTIDTVVAPRANGYRNTGTAGVFVICGYSNASSYDLVYARFIAATIDGQSHSFTCTAVNGVYNYPSGPQVYVSKTIDIDATNGYTVGGWSPEDFNATGTIPWSGLNFSFTCNLPPGTAITSLYSSSYTEIGN